MSLYFYKIPYKIDIFVLALHISQSQGNGNRYSSKTGKAKFRFLQRRNF